MKRTGLINLICSLIAVIAIVITVMLIFVFRRISALEDNTLVISSASAAGTYNGEPITDDRWDLLEGDLNEGHKLYVEVSGSQTDVGMSENTLSAVVRDADGNDVSAEYNIQYKPGSLSIRSKRITLTAASQMKEYDGTPLYLNDYTIDNPSAIIEGATMYVTVEGSITEIGTAQNVITDVDIYNEYGENITRNYSIKIVKGELRVYSPDDLIIRSASDQKYFDGTPLKNDKWELVSGELLPGHTLIVDVIGSQTRPGSAKNEFNAAVIAVIDEENGYENVTEYYYEIVKVYGDLIVMKEE